MNRKSLYWLYASLMVVCLLITIGVFSGKLSFFGQGFGDLGLLVMQLLFFNWDGGDDGRSIEIRWKGQKVESNFRAADDAGNGVFSAFDYHLAGR